ncbi:MAG: murein hydrolase activator EnvC [Alphaproteobacteria bacterium]
MLRRIAVIACCFHLVQAPPAYASTQDKLKQTEKELAESKQKQQQLKKKQVGLVKELEALQRKLVEAVAAIQKNEQALLKAEQQLSDTAVRLEEKKQQIDRNKGRLEALVSVALRFSRMPPEAMVMMPEDSRQTLRVSKALAMLSKDIKEQTQQLGHQKQELEALQVALGEQKQAMLKQQEELGKKRTGLQGQLAERKRLQAALKKDQEKEIQRAAQLARKASGLKELLKELEKQAEVHADPSAPDDSAYKGKLRSFVAAKGRIRMPVTGNIASKYGEKEKSGGGSHGVVIATASHAQVIAPYDGEVIFAGTFLNYGRMIILRHRDDFHTLLAGFDRLDIQTGEFLLEGEPIGAMGSKESQKRLYIELRKQNKPVDPGPWIKGL